MVTSRFATGTLVLLVIGVLGAAGTIAYARYLAPPERQSEVASILADRLGIDLNQYPLQLSGASADQVDVWWYSGFVYPPTQVVSRGVSTGATPREHGENTFFLCYGESLLGRFGQFKMNRRHYHRYLISIGRNADGTLHANVTVTGPDEADFDRYREGSYSSLSDRDEWTFLAKHCKRSAVGPRVAADRAAPGR